MQACDIVLIKKGEGDEISEEIDNRLIGIVKWFDESKGYGIIGTPEGTDYFLRKADVQSKFISAGNVVVFFGKNKNGKNIALKCKHTFGYKDWKLAFSYVDKDDIVTVEFIKEREKDWGYGTYRYTEKQGISIIGNTLNRLFKQKESLSEFELCTLSLNLLQTKFAKEGYVLIKEIVSNNNLKDEDKKLFLKSAFGKATAERQYRMLFVDNLIDIQKETPESQIELLQKFEGIDFDEIKSIVQSDKIEETVKGAFLKSAFEKASTEYQYKMLFDGLIILSEDNQIVFLQKYLLELGSVTYSNYGRIISIAQSDKIKEKAKNAFLKSAFEKASTEYQYKMMFADNLVDIQKESIKSQIELLQKFEGLDIVKIKTITQSDKIEETVKGAFLKSSFEKASTDCQFEMLFDDNLMNIQDETSESQIELLQKYLLKLDRLDKIDIVSGWKVYDPDWRYNKIKIIAQSDKIKDTAKVSFIKSVFEKAITRYQYKMLFDDNLIDIQKESSESQIELLRKLERLDIDKIKSIMQSDKIEETVKGAFLKSAFAKARAADQIKIIKEESLINGVSKKLEFLIIATKSDGSKFPSRGFHDLYLLENNIEYLHKNIKNKGANIREFYNIVTKKKKGKMNLYGNNMYSYNGYELSSTYNYCKETWCDILVEIYQAIDNQNLFANDKTEDVLEKITQLVEIRELYEIFKVDFDKTKYNNFLKHAIEHLDFNFIENVENYKWLACVKQNNLELYTILFEQNYCNR